jgi:hypothetical protein
MLEYFSEHTYNMRKMCNVGALHATPETHDIIVGRMPYARTTYPVSDRREDCKDFYMSCKISLHVSLIPRKRNLLIINVIIALARYWLIRNRKKLE